MPYTYEKYPTFLKTYPIKIRHQWVQVYNNVFNRTKSEKRAFMGANSILKKRVRKKEELSKSQYFNYLVDSWMGKLQG